MPTRWACASPRGATPTARCTTRWASTRRRDDDLVVPSEGIALVVSPAHRDLLDGMTLDYVEYEAGDFRFIFINPNDARRAPPAADDAGCGSRRLRLPAARLRRTLTRDPRWPRPPDRPTAAELAASRAPGPRPTRPTAARSTSSAPAPATPSC